MKVKCLIDCKIGKEIYVTGIVYEMIDLTAAQQLASAEYFRSVNKFHKVFFEKVIEKKTSKI